MTNFKNLYETDISRFVEKKGRFDYLSWAYAWKEFKIVYPDASFIVHEYSEYNLPFLKTDIGYFVKVSVTANKHTHTELLPVTNNKNETIAKPNAFDINYSIKRCLAKAIALHGLGLILWVNEDLPQNTEQVKPKTGLNQTPAQTTAKPRNDWEEKLLRQAKGDESLLIKISDGYTRGIKSEKQYHFFANKLTAMGHG
jgi:hypothetical protein